VGLNIFQNNKTLCLQKLRVCLDSERITLFELVVKNSVRLVISQEMWEQYYFLLFRVSKLLFGW
jgi:hypothetical protein